ncbi:MAG: hypothetical protein SFX72_01580 [Isosphaeraceae bacterium]|nr:hypothetical protein [Isosphaeraceae bacterium]
MRRSLILRAAGALLVAASPVLVGCGDEQVKLADAPPAAIGELKKEAETGSKDSLKKGAPAKGSSSGIRHNPSETPN